MNNLPRPHPLVFKCRTAIRDTAEAFWSKGWKLHDLKTRNADLHKRLLAGIAAMDKACGRGEDDINIVARARELVVLWREAAQAMPAGGVVQREWE
jgi:hypothetical protein